MAEINNSLALGIKAPEFDIIKPLMGAAQINSLRANTAKTQQDIDYNQTLQDQGQNGMRPQEENTWQAAKKSGLDVAGQIGNAMVRAKTLEDRKQVIQMSHDAGRPVDPKTEQSLLTMPLDQFHQHGEVMQQGGMAPQSSIEQNPAQVAKRSYMGAAATTAGAVGGDLPAVPSVPAPAMQQRPASAPIRTNPDGSIAGNLATEPARVAQAPTAPVMPPARINPAEQAGATAARNAERQGNAVKNVDEFARYKSASENAPTIKNGLRQIIDDSDKVYTGPLAERKDAANRVIYAMEQMPIVGKAVTYFAGDKSDPVAAFENIKKNMGQIARQAVGDIGERSNAALDSVTSSLPHPETSQKGIRQAASQLMAVQDFAQARTIEATKWLKTHQSLDGFAADWTQNMGPATFVMARLPKEEQLAVRKRMSATKEGQRSLEQIDKQIDWAKAHGLGSVID